MSEQAPAQPQVITLDKNVCINIMVQYIEVSQRAGAFDLKEADVLKRAVDFLVNNAPDNELNEGVALNLLVQGIVRGQKHGAFTLNDAALLHKVLSFLSQLMEPQQPSVQQPPATEQPAVQQQVAEPVAESNDDDLASLSDPVPLRPQEIKCINF